MASYLVFDWGGTALKFAVMDESCAILEQGEQPTPDPDANTRETFYQAIDKMVEPYLGRVEGIAISMPGMLDNQDGYCKSAGTLRCLIGATVGTELSERYGIPVSVENDGKCAVLAEYWRGALRGCRNCAVIGIGTAIAGGIIIDGKLHRGRDFTAGECSFMCLDYTRARKDKLAWWGHMGGVRGLQRLVAAHTGERWEELNGRIIFERANAGDADTLAGLREFCELTAVQIHNVNIVLDLDRIAIGGGISRQPLLLEVLREEVQRLADENPMGPGNPNIPVPQVVACQFFNEANLIGALYHFLTKYGLMPQE